MSEKKERIVLDVAYQPQVRTNTDTRRIMLDVMLALLPAIAVAVWQFGPYPLLVIAVSMASAALFEWGYRKLLKKNSTVGDLSACVTGMLLALVLPPDAPWWLPVIGSFFAIVGGNGTGKTTTLKAACGICKLYRGSVRLFGKPLSAYRDGLFQNCLAMLPQDPKCLFVKQTLREDLEEMGASAEKQQEIARLCQVDGLLDAHPADLSGGETQRSALAKVLLAEPRLLLLDEPTKGLDSFFKQSFAGILKDLCRQGITVVMVSHDVEFCAEYADLVSMFFDGQLLTTDTPRRFFGSNSFYTTAANRMSRRFFENAVTARDVTELLEQNQEDAP